MVSAQDDLADGATIRISCSYPGGFCGTGLSRAASLSPLGWRVEREHRSGQEECGHKEVTAGEDALIEKVATTRS